MPHARKKTPDLPTPFLLFSPIFILTTNVGQRMIAEMVQEGKSMEEIAARMREALSQIRHTKSDRPVFTPEFLARVKRVIVFYPLNKEAMAGITRKLVGELQERWAAKRGKRLEVPETLVCHIAEQSHLLNEKSKGKEGGRIVRKLLAEWLEAVIQRETTFRPAEYKDCIVVSLDQVQDGPSTEAASLAAPEIRIHFRKG
jgi:ATP-dependent Clp protease ATP-binding subunit ClpA